MDQKNLRSRGTSTGRPANASRRTYEEVRRPAAHNGRPAPARRKPKKKPKAKRLNFKRLLVFLVVLAIAAGIAWLVYDIMHQTQHMLPTIQRIPEYAQETAVPQ